MARPNDRALARRLMGSRGRSRRLAGLMNKKTLDDEVIGGMDLGIDIEI